MFTSRLCTWIGVAGLGGALLASPAEAANVGLTLGTSGLGADLTVPVAERIQTRFHLAFLKVDREATASDVDYDVTFKNHQAGVLLDYHPFAGGLRLSTGLMLSDFGLDLSADYADENVEIGDNTYEGELHLEGQTTFNRVTPYVGFGWASTPTETGLSFVADIGVIMIGEGNLDLEATGTVSQVGTALQDIPVETFAEFQEDLEKERQKAEDDIQDLTLFPVINLGLSYAF
jgi:hypothetical protein